MLPKLAALMDDAECDVLVYASFPKDHRPKIQSTNASNGPTARSSATEVVSIFPDEKAIKRLVGAILLEQNDEWAVLRSLYDAGKNRRSER